ncbi:Ig-like domain-containing protein [Tenacibaculum sp. 190524A02b]|uniref:Ig-like domain-containing protein n=1 Tax=Tenacibaculum vairaonense TaxID=3137860 RepID=UPI0031FA628F
MRGVIKVCVLIFVGLLVTSCARRGNPEGGPKDENAPIMVTANPPYESIEFDEKNIRIYFDEYIVLKDLTKQLVVSPPFKNPALIEPQGTPSKYINIKILDTLKSNTTYTFNFGNAVQDNNEGNKLESFKYVFSTGKYIDSLKTKGSVKDALTRETDKSIGVLLYRIDSSFNDSIIYKRKPDYVTSTLDSTSYNFSNIKEGNYLLLALKESANDYIFNPKIDKIGFLSDTISLPRDSVINKDIRIFKEKQPFKFKRGKEISKGKIQFGFEGGKDSLKIELLSKVPQDFNSYFQFEKDKDTLFYWHSPIKRDSLNFTVTKNDFIDTITVRLRKKKLDSLSLSSNVKSILHLNDTLFFEANNPLIKTDSTKITFVDQDTVAVNYQLKKIDINKLAILFEKKPKTNYELTVLPNAFVDLYETKNDTLNYKFNTKDIEDYGSIVIDLQKKVNAPVIIELLEKDEVVKTVYVSTSKKITFDLLEPKEYSVRAIIDENKNNKWDSGNFLRRIQPERVIYFEKEFKLRANWIQNESFTIE